MSTRDIAQGEGSQQWEENCHYFLGVGIAMDSNTLQLVSSYKKKKDWTMLDLLNKREKICIDDIWGLYVSIDLDNKGLC